MLILIHAFARSAFRDTLSFFWALLFPLALLLGLGSAFDDTEYRRALLSGVSFYSAAFFAASGTAFLVLGQRNQGVYKLLRATPAPVSRFIVALVLARGLLGGLCAVLVLLLGGLALDISPSLAEMLGALPVLGAILVAFSLLGFVVGNLANNESQTAGLNNFVTLPVMFATSAMYSIERLPEWLQTVAHWLPFEGALSALRAALAGHWSTVGEHTPGLLLFVLASVALARLTFRWDPHAPVRLSWRDA